jgi:hypothetical protein
MPKLLDSEIGMKSCLKCLEILPRIKFHKHSKTYDGLNSWCKQCTKKVNAKWVIKNKERRASKTLAWRLKNAEQIFGYNIRRNYGVTLDQYKQRLEEQGFACAICKTTNNGSRKFGIDHNHKTGKIRGLLCHKCNAGLGNFDDNLDRLKKAIAYMEDRDA